MHSRLMALLIVAWFLVGDPREGLAQWTANKADASGMFGQRSLGETLKPRPSRFADGLRRGPSGNFRGRGRPDGGMMFGSSTQQNLAYRQREAAAGRRPRGAVRHVGPSERFVPPPPRPIPPVPEAEPLPPREVAPPAEVPPPEAVRPPDIWFRSAPEETESGATGRSAGTGLTSAAGTRLQTPLPPRLRIAFSRVQPTGHSGVVLAAHIRRCDRIRALSPITVTVEHQTAVLRGRVAGEHDRVLAEQFARMEPGIWQVRNELIVGSAPLISAASRAGQ